MISGIAPVVDHATVNDWWFISCYEGVEKVPHSLHQKAKTEEEASQELTAIETDMATFEKDKVSYDS